MHVTLTVTEGPHQGLNVTFEEHDNFIVGRSPCAHFRLPVKDKTISRVHFMLEVNPPSCRLIDMGSRNGTFVNGRRVSSANVKHGDQIRGGSTTFKVSVSGSEDSFVATQAVDLRSIANGDRDENAPTLDKYVIEQELGRGGMGVVYLARKGQGGEQVALKAITPTGSGSKHEIARFLREASILRKLTHPNIVGFREMDEVDGQIYFAMEYVPGTDASRLLEQNNGPLPIERAVGIICQVLGALAYAHEQGVVHRDIKPANVLLAQTEKRDVVKLADFGLARVYQCSRLSGVTMMGSAGGTVPFMAPEQITHYREAKPAVDIYSAAATLYYLLTGCYVYQFEGRPEQQILAVLQDDPVSIRDRRREIPELLAIIIHQALNREPGDRFESAAVMRRALLPFANSR